MTITIESVNRSACIVADGGWGTEFQKMGLEPGASPEHWNLHYPERVESVAAGYVRAGARIILTNTFGGNSFILARHGLRDRLAEVNRRGAEISKAAAGNSALVFGSMGPTGKLLQTGEVTEAELSRTYALQSEALWSGGADALLIETMIDLDEMRIAARAARESTPLPIVLSMTFDSGKEKTQTMMGVTPERAAAVMEECGAWMVGANCGVGPETYVRVCRKLRASSTKPVWIKANAGIPEMIGGRVHYSQGPELFGNYALELRNAGANVIGGCCGTGPEHIRRLRDLLESGRSRERADGQ